MNSYKKENELKKQKEKISIEEVKQLVSKEDVDFLLNVMEPLQKEASKLSNHPSDQYNPEMFDFYRNLYNNKIT